MQTKNYWLLKTEPDVFSINDLLKDKITIWSGVRNYQARNYIRDQMKIGDQCFIYHSSCKSPGIFGLGAIVSEPYFDPTQFDKKSEYYDKKSTAQKTKKDRKNVWFVVDIEFLKKFTKIMSLEEIKNTSELSDMLVVKKGSRLSIQPVTRKDFELIINLSCGNG